MKVKKKSQGITLVSLVITVVIMLILAGVTISVFTGTDGMFSSITQATREYKKQAMLEAVDLAKAYVELDKTYTNEPITIADVIDKIKEVSTINDEDYIITVDDEEQTATIIDKATGVVVDIWIDENGHIQSDGNIVDDVENLVKPTVTYELDPPAGTNADEVKITITATEEKNGIVRMVLPDNSEIIYNKEKEVTKEYIVTENGTYTFVVEGANGRKTTKYVEVQNITSVANIVMEVQNTEPTNQAVNVLITYDENVKMRGQVLVNADRFQYSIGENNWQNALSANTTIQVGVNGTVYARYYDGNQGYKTTSITIQNIDKVSPNVFNLSITKTTNSITVSGSTTDTATAGCATNNYGIAGYQFQLKDNAGSVITSWTTVQAGTSYTFSNLTQGTTYQVSMRAVDKAGNTTEATNKDESVTLSTVMDSSTAIGISYNPTTPTQGNVQVTFTNNSGQSGLTLKYQIGSTSGSWTEYTGPVTMEINGTVYARLFDSNNQYTNTATATVQNIDRINPTTAAIASSNVEETTFTLTATGADRESGIAKYEFYINNILEHTVTTSSGTATYNVTGKTGNISYTCKVRVYDKAGNHIDSTEISVKTERPGMPIADAVKVGDYVDYDAGVWTEEDFDKITNSIGSPTVNKSTALPNREKQFGGFVLGQSRNTNSTPYDEDNKPSTSGWIVWDIDKSTGEVTLVSAGHPETYYCKNVYDGTLEVLVNRECGMYENEHAKKGYAHILRGGEARDWYNKYYDKNFQIGENGRLTSSSLITDVSYCWLPAHASGLGVTCVRDSQLDCNGDYMVAYGVRILVVLKGDTRVQEGAEGSYVDQHILLD